MIHVLAFAHSRVSCSQYTVRRGPPSIMRVLSSSSSHDVLLFPTLFGVMRTVGLPSTSTRTLLLPCLGLLERAVLVEGRPIVRMTVLFFPALFVDLLYAALTTGWCQATST